jgi:DNA repair protein RadC
MVAGLGNRRAEQIQSAVEIGRRVASANRAIEDTISSSDDVVSAMRPLLKELKHEECWAIYLTNSNRIIERCRISQGGVQATVVDQRLIVKRALELLSTRIILVHNHPSGSATPSGADFEITKRIKEATSLFDIQLLDHIIISASESYSFKSSGKL